MVFTRRTAKLQASSHDGSNASNNDTVPMHVITGDGPAQVQTVVCEDAAREAADPSAHNHGSGNEGSGALTDHISTEDESVSSGPRSLVCSNTESIDDIPSHLEGHGEAQPRTEPRETTQAEGQGEGERFLAPRSSAHPSPTTPNRVETTKKSRKGTRTRWTRTKKQTKGKANEPAQNPKATESINTVGATTEEPVPAQQRPMKPLPRRATNIAEIIEAGRKAEATAKKGKWKANPEELPSTRDASTGSKRARNESPFDVEDNPYPHLGWTIRRVRQRTAASLVTSPVNPVKSGNTRQLRRGRPNLLVSVPTTRTGKRKASVLEPLENHDIAKRCRTESTFPSLPPPTPSASDVVDENKERTPSGEPSILLPKQIKCEELTPSSLQLQPSSSSPPAHMSLNYRPFYPYGPDGSYVPDNLWHIAQDIQPILTRDRTQLSQANLTSHDVGMMLRTLPLEWSTPSPDFMTYEEMDASGSGYGVHRRTSYIELPEEHNEMRDVEDALYVNNAAYARTAPVIDDSVQKLQDLQLAQQMFSGPIDPAMEDAETTDDDFTAPPDGSQLSRLLAAITHPNAIVNGGFVHWFPPSEMGAAPSPISSLPAVQSYRPYRHRSEYRSVANPDLSLLLRDQTTTPAPEWHSTALRRSMTPESRHRETSPSIPRFGSSSRSPSRSPPPSRERSMAPEPSDDLVEAIRAGRVSMCPSPCPTECDAEE